jgi:hypothetical protein
MSQEMSMKTSSLMQKEYLEQVAQQALHLAKLIERQEAEV